MSRGRLFFFLALTVIMVAAVVVIVLATQDDSGRRISVPPAGPYRGSTVPAAMHLPSFSLRDQSGRTVSARGLRGKVVVFTFLDTDCKDSCPIIANVIGATIPRLSRGERQHVAALAVTVNPTADSPPKALGFLRRHRALGQLDFLLGTVEDLKPVWRSFMILSAQESGDADIHSAPVRIYDRNGKWVSTLHAGVDLTAVNLLHDIREALRS